MGRPCSGGWNGFAAVETLRVCCTLDGWHPPQEVELSRPGSQDGYMDAHEAIWIGRERRIGRIIDGVNDVYCDAVPHFYTD